MGERSIRRDGKGGAILSQALQPHFVAEALAFFLRKSAVFFVTAGAIILRIENGRFP
jgi:hypothetical protein